MPEMIIVTPKNLSEVLVHKIYTYDMEAYRRGAIDKVKAQCGKIWAPDPSIDVENTPRCPRCFPRFALAS